MPTPHLTRFFVVSLLALMASGCTPWRAVSARNTVAPPTDRQLAPAVRYGRYRLMELTPDPAQDDLLLQVVDVTIPPALDATVGDALRHLLMRTGYRLCESPAMDALTALPLPAAHLHLGPLILRDALKVLAGPAWELAIDDTQRQICFSPRDTVNRAAMTMSTTVSSAWTAMPVIHAADIVAAR